jgi:hypothetical protein
VISQVNLGIGKRFQREMDGIALRIAETGSEQKTKGCKSLLDKGLIIGS